MADERSFRDHYCFGCGRLNPLGLHLEFRRDSGGVVAQYRPRPEDEGFPGIMHGGLLAVLLDEAMGWALYIDRIFAVTARMETRFRRSPGLQETFEIRAAVTSRRGRRLHTVASIRDEEGGVVAEAEGLFLRAQPDQEAAWLAHLETGGPVLDD